MAARKRPAASAKAAKPDITPEEPKVILKLTEAQAEQVMKAMRDVAVAEKIAKERQVTLQNLLTMVRPEEANGFDPNTMTFYSVPQEAPKE